MHISVFSEHVINVRIALAANVKNVIFLCIIKRNIGNVDLSEYCVVK